MTVAVACNLSEGVILGVDSAVTIPGEGGVIKVYENAEKLFQLAKRPIGVAVYGIGALGARGIGSYLHEFELTQAADLAKPKVGDVVEALRAFFMQQYREVIGPAAEEQFGKPFEEIPLDTLPALGLVVGGFSAGEHLSEVWSIVIPAHAKAGSAEQPRPQGSFGSNWFAMFDPIRRYVKGFDPQLLDSVVEHFVAKRGSSLSDDEKDELRTLIEPHEYQIPFNGMPLQEGIEYTRFLVDLCINHHRFSVGAPVVGGKATLGTVTYRGDRFEILGDLQ